MIGDSPVCDEREEMSLNIMRAVDDVCIGIVGKILMGNEIWHLESYFNLRGRVIKNILLFIWFLIIRCTLSKYIFDTFKRTIFQCKPPECSL